MKEQYYGEDSLCLSHFHEWYRRFKSGRMSIERDPKSGRHSTLMHDDDVDIVHTEIRQNRHLAVRAVVQEAAFSKCS